MEEKFTMRIRGELFRAMMKKIAELGGQRDGWTQKSVIEQLLAEWTGGQREVASPDRKPASDRYSDDLERLERVLDRCSAADRLLIRNLLHMAEKATEPKAKETSQNPLQSSRSGQKRPHVGR